jgi:hypothetical protein
MLKVITPLFLKSNNDEIKNIPYMLNTKKLLLIILITLLFSVLTACVPPPKVVCYDSVGTNCVCYPKNEYKMCYPEYADGYGVCELKYRSCPE